MCPIKKILVEESSSDIQAYFGSQSQSQNAMGHMIENKNFLNILLELTRKNKNIFKYDSKLLDYRRTEKQVFAYLENNRIIEGKLIIAADGRNSYVRKLADIKYNYKDYNQKAFTFDVKHTKKHHNLAVEKFIEQGPLAILPIIRKNTQKYSSVVWSCNHPNYYEYLDKGNKKIRTLLEHYFMKFYGNINLVSKVSTWDLSLIHSKKYTDHRVLLLGDAAHSIHPLAGQGFNLTVRGIKKVYSFAKNENLADRDIGKKRYLAEYSTKHYLDAISLIFVTDKLNFLFSNSNFLLKKIRRTGLKVFRRSNLLNNTFKNYATKGALLSIKD